MCASRPPLSVNLADDPAVRNVIEPFKCYANTDMKRNVRANVRLSPDTAVAGGVARPAVRPPPAEPPTRKGSMGQGKRCSSRLAEQREPAQLKDLP